MDPVPRGRSSPQESNRKIVSCRACVRACVRARDVDARAACQRLVHPDLDVDANGTVPAIQVACPPSAVHACSVLRPALPGPPRQRPRAVSYGPWRRSARGPGCPGCDAMQAPAGTRWRQAQAHRHAGAAGTRWCRGPELATRAPCTCLAPACLRGRLATCSAHRSTKSKTGNRSVPADGKNSLRRLRRVEMHNATSRCVLHLCMCVYVVALLHYHCCMCMYICACACVFFSMTGVCVCMSVCVFVCICMYICVCACVFEV